MGGMSNYSHLDEEREALDREFSSSFSPYSYSKHPEPYYSPYVPKNNSIAQLNRHTGKLHEHAREIARNLRKKKQ